MSLKTLCRLFFASSMLVLLVAACARSAPEEETPVEATAAPAAEAQVDTDADAASTSAPAEEPTAAASAPAQTSVVTVGVNAEFAPFVYLDENGNLAGFDIDMMNALNAVLDFEVAYVNTSFEDLFSGLENGELDAAISAITVTDARRERVDFTDPYFASGLSVVSYFSAGQGLATRTDNTTITGVESLTEGVTLGVKRGTTGAEFAAANTAAEIVAYDESTPLLQALVNGDVQAIILDTPVIIRFIKNNPGASIKLTGGPITEEVYAIAVSKEHPQVVEALNEGLRIIQADGAYDTIYTKWFGAP